MKTQKINLIEKDFDNVINQIIEQMKEHLYKALNKNLTTKEVLETFFNFGISFSISLIKNSLDCENSQEKAEKIMHELIKSYDGFICESEKSSSIEFNL